MILFSGMYNLKRAAILGLLMLFSALFYAQTTINFTYVQSQLPQADFDIELIKKTLFSVCPTPKLINFFTPIWPSSKKVDFSSFPKPTFLK